MGILDYFKKKKETEFDKDDHPDEIKKSTRRPMQYSEECDKLSEDLQKCVSKKNGLSLILN
jgi:hypothetical protein